MKKRVLTLCFALCFLFTGLAQEPTVTAEVNMDSILLGNYFELKITAENIPNADIQTPDFGGFQLRGGPNYSSSMQIINGDVSQSVTQTYWLEPTDIGQFYIGPAQVKSEDTMLETPPIEINVYHNPDGIVQSPQKQSTGDSWFQWPERRSPAPKKKPKKKRKVYRL